MSVLKVVRSGLSRVGAGTAQALPCIKVPIEGAADYSLTKKHQNLGWMKGEGDEGFFFLLTFLDFFLDFHSNFID